MQIIGHRLTKVLGKKGTLEKGFTININVDLKEIKSQDIFPGGEKRVGVSFDFVFEAEYGKKGGKISVEGAILGTGEEKEIKKVIKDWKANKLAPEIEALIKNRILGVGYAQSIPLAESLSLPLPLKLPRFVPPSETKK